MIINNLVKGNSDMKSELVVMSPIQIKRNLSVGNIYDLTLNDFYAKARRFGGREVSLPLLWNVNGQPLIKQMREDGIKLTPRNIEEYISKLIYTARNSMEDHYLDFDLVLRDDQISESMDLLARTSYSGAFRVGSTNINECLSCRDIYGSDPSITNCRSCNYPTTFHQRNTMFKPIRREDIESKMRGIEFFPSGIERRLASFIGDLPDEYDLILEKNRQYTVEHNGFRLDPRFVAIMLPAILNQLSGRGPYNIRTFIHGDVVKKFDYYSLCYLNEGDLPTRIAVHGLLIGQDKRKLRWQEDHGDQVHLFKGVDKKILRAYFLKQKFEGNTVLSERNLQAQSTGLTRIYLKMKRVLEERNMGRFIMSIRGELHQDIENFNRHIDQFNFHRAFDHMNSYLNKCWKIVKNDKLSLLEIDNLIKFKEMYFGK